MGIFQTVQIIMTMLDLVMKEEPALEKDIRDILAIMDQIRQRYMQASKP